MIPSRSISQSQKHLTLLGADTAIPLITNPLTTTCQDNPAGQPLTTIALITQTAAWALATLFAAGFTTIIRKT